jgi:hypothetical protein
VPAAIAGSADGALSAAVRPASTTTSTSRRASRSGHRGGTGRDSYLEYGPVIEPSVTNFGPDNRY